MSLRNSHLQGMGGLGGEGRGGRGEEGGKEYEGLAPEGKSCLRPCSRPLYAAVIRNLRNAIRHRYHSSDRRV